MRMTSSFDSTADIASTCFAVPSWLAAFASWGALDGTACCDGFELSMPTTFLINEQGTGHLHLVVTAA
jgi:hypothetical protein